jgi:transcriptional regulator GlxA family with amidase domain
MLRNANNLPRTGLSAIPILDHAMQRAVILMREHAFGGIRIKEVAMQLGLNPVQFTRRFRAAYQITPIEYITTIRMHRACTLLAGTTLKLEMIARQCGYENGFYFSRAFSSHTGLNPSEYRKQHRV